MSQNLPPASIEAEEAILGCVLFQPEVIVFLIKNLPVEAFYVAGNQEIYRAMIAIHENQEIPDFLSVSSYLAAKETLEMVGGTANLSSLLNSTVSAVNIDRYVKLVVNKYRRRRLIAMSNAISDLAYDQVRTFDEVLGEIKLLANREINPASISDSKPIPGKITYTVYSQSRQRKIDLEANVDDVRNIKEQIKPLEEHCEITAKELWGDELDDSDKSNKAVLDV